MRFSAGFRHAFTCLLVLVPVATAPVPAQVATTIPTTVSCRACALRITHVVNLVDPSGDLNLDITDAQVVRDRRGRYYYVPLTSPERIVVFDSNGVAIETIGRGGAGPGEFRGITALNIDDADSLYVIDGTQRRVSVFTPGGSVARTFLVNGSLIPGSSLLAPDRSLIVNATMGEPAGFGLPLHQISAEGDHIASFGAPPGRTYRVDDYYAIARVIALAPDQTVWAATPNRYQFEHWSTDGNLLTVLEGDPTWFDAYDAFRPTTATQPPIPMVIGIRVLEAGHLIVTTVVPAEDWRDGVEEVTGPHGLAWATTDWAKAYDTVIEVLDPSTGALLASKRTDLFLSRSVDEETYVSYAQSPRGEPRLAVWRVQFLSQR